jgi:tetratricopeptide (TPR) repeat protein
MRWASLATPRHGEAAVSLARQALALSDREPRAFLTLAAALRTQGRPDEAKAVLEDAGRRFPGDEDVAADLAGLALLCGDHERARALAEAAPRSAWSARLRLTLHGRGIDVDAEAAEAALAVAAPDDGALFARRATRLRGDPAALLALAATFLRLRPGHADGLHIQAVALAMLGRDAEATALMGIERFVQRGRVQLATAPFLERLRREIESNPTLRPDPQGYAQRGGLRTRRFPDLGDAAAPALVAALKDVAGAHAEALAGDHPFVASRPDQALFTCWAMFFRAAGRQVRHIHPECWMTGVFYVAAPAGAPQAGAIRIGRLPDWAGVSEPWPVLELAPEPGSYVLFPSFVPHETVPTGVDEPRVAVAFDVTAA